MTTHRPLRPRPVATAITAAALLTWVAAGSLRAQGSVPTDAGAGTDTIRVGTWNLEHLGQRKNPPRDEASWRALGAFVRGLDVAVLAVQEVRDSASARRLCESIGPRWTFVLGSSGNFRESADAIRLGFVFDRDRVELIGARELLDLPRVVDGVPIFHRVPITACFRALPNTADAQGAAGGIDFRLVTCHLKASRGEENAHKRCLEMGQLVAWLRGLGEDPAEDRDVLLLGDFNHTYGDPAWVVFEQSGLGRYLKPDAAQPTIVWFDTPIDHIVAMRGIEDELVAGGFAVANRQMLADRDAWRATYSDHVPVVATLARVPDRDPAARFDLGPGEHHMPVGRLAQPPAQAATAVSTGAASTAPGAAAADTPPVDTLPPALSRGDNVVVQLRDGSALSGRLLRAPGDWIHLLDWSGALHAIPERSVLSIRGKR